MNYEEKKQLNTKRACKHTITLSFFTTVADRQSLELQNANFLVIPVWIL